MKNLTLTLRYVISIICIGSTFGTLAQPNDTTKVGIYITSIYDLDYNSSSFAVEYWMWRLNTNRKFKEDYLFSVINAKETNRIWTSTNWPDQSENQFPNITGDTLFWDYENFKSIVKHDYDIDKYPFDEEVLTIDFEGETYYDNWVNLKIDQENSGSEKLEINGWQVGPISIDTISNTYPSNFGSPGDVGGHTYSGFRVMIPIKRNGMAMFFKLFSGLFVAFVIALFSLRINITEADGRFGVCVGALFAALANMYIVNSNLPMVSKFTFMDKAHVLTIFLILVLFITSTFSLRYYKQEKLGKSIAIDKVVTYSVLLIFILGMIIIWP